MTNWKTHNNRVFSDKLEHHANTVIKAKIASMLSRVADWMITYIEDAFEGETGSEQFPVYSANLHDATGIGVYMDGVMTAYKPTQRAVEPNDGVLGATELDRALNEATNQFATGIWIVLFSAVPYAYEVNIAGSPWNRGIGFFDEMEEWLKTDVFGSLKEVKS